MTNYLEFVNNNDFLGLFEELGWGTVSSRIEPLPVDIGEGRTVEAVPVADEAGLRVWVVTEDELPTASEQRVIDNKIRQLSQVHLLILTDGTTQSWRWPRRGATAATNSKLLHHHYTIGNEDQGLDLARRLEFIDLPVGEKLGILEIQQRVAKAFNDEAVSRSKQASGHMQVMNQQLLDAGCSTEEASSLLVRLLFLFFGDDTQMWPDDTFKRWVLNCTTAETINDKLTELFEVLCDPELDEAFASPAKGKYAGTEYKYFRRIDGMYQEKIELPTLTEDFRQQVLDACDFDWGKVNPDIFGAMFQQLVDIDELRKNGEHYTSEENIMKVIEPMFLDEYRQRVEDNFDNRKELLAIQNEISTLQFLDPACGCGNFLIQAYKQLRGLEFEIITRAEELELEEIHAELLKREHQRMGKTKQQLVKRRDEIQGGASIQFQETALRKSKLSMRQFYGIEINQWPAKVASTAMLLVDHLCNQAWGTNVVRLPIEETSTIKVANALTFDWNELVPDNGATTYVFGNPPFIGQYTKTAEQKADMKRVWGKDYDGYLDYVTGWHAQAKNFLKNRSGEFAYVTTNSITQGQPVPALFGPLKREGWRIKFAHRTFAWNSESDTKAAVHCVVVGFTRDQGVKQRLWDYPEIQGEPIEQKLRRGINAYLIDGGWILVDKASKPLSPEVLPAIYGSKLADGGNLIIEDGDYDEVVADHTAAEYVRPLVGSRELIHGLKRWCLWLEDANPNDLQQSEILRQRVQAVKDFREKSTKTGDAYKLRHIPHLFRPNALRPTDDYLCVPRVVSESRRYFTAQQLPGSTIVSDSAFTVDDPSGLSFALISSSMFITWQKTVGGRLESRLRFSNTLTWNTFPVPELDEETRERIIAAGKQVLAARELHPERSLADHYKPNGMDPALLAAHDALDEEVDRAMGAPHKLSTERERQELLFANYLKLTEKAV